MTIYTSKCAVSRKEVPFGGADDNPECLGGENPKNFWARIGVIACHNEQVSVACGRADITWQWATVVSNGPLYVEIPGADISASLLWTVS